MPRCALRPELASANHLRFAPRHATQASVAAWPAASLPRPRPGSPVPAQHLVSARGLCPPLAHAAPEETPACEDPPPRAIKTPHAFYPTAAAGGGRVLGEAGRRLPASRLCAASGGAGSCVPGGWGCLRACGSGFRHRECGTFPRERMDLPDPADLITLPKHILDIWVIVLIILATILVMTALVLCPATAVIIYRVRTHPTRNGIV
ncbi:small integral membrane protein 3 isoform X1 [Harpia harpyja]|uniref:small integral membrane protein 3 isoform X1 n=1 Tax=Harpia harpyja TaxID=202280 RepID=UPI0022B18FDA|nr:small integral membrane protein 3 isoform X1 [Harpia harpyja]